jgi:hypothetical protein
MLAYGYTNVQIVSVRAVIDFCYTFIDFSIDLILINQNIYFHVVSAYSF